MNGAASKTARLAFPILRLPRLESRCSSVCIQSDCRNFGHTKVSFPDYTTFQWTHYKKHELANEIIKAAPPLTVIGTSVSGAISWSDIAYAMTPYGCWCRPSGLSAGRFTGGAKGYQLTRGMTNETSPSVLEKLVILADDPDGDPGRC